MLAVRQGLSVAHGSVEVKVVVVSRSTGALRGMVELTSSRDTSCVADCVSDVSEGVGGVRSSQDAISTHQKNSRYMYSSLWSEGSAATLVTDTCTSQLWIKIMAKITVLGAGEFGSALSYVLQRAGHTCTMWDVDASKMPEPHTLESALQQAQFVIAAVPSWVLRTCLTNAVPHIPEGAIVISIAKGMERESHATTDVLCHEVLGDAVPTVFLSGPMLAEELVMDRPAGAVLASTNTAALVATRALFVNTSLRVTTTDDVRGVVLCGVLKNVYTIGVGMLVALELGDNARGTYTAVAVEEMARQCEALGGRHATMFGIAGIGDFVASSAGMYSRNFTFGYEFVKDPEKATTAEGVASYGSLVQKLGGESALAHYPLLSGIVGVLRGVQSPAAFFTQFYQ